MDPRLCGTGVIGAGSARKGMELKMFTAGMESFMVAAGDKATMVLAGREASAAKGKSQLVPFRLKKVRVQDRQNLQELLSCHCCLGPLKESFFSSLSFLVPVPQPTSV